MNHHLCPAAYHPTAYRTKRSGIACLVLLSVMSYVPAAHAIFHLWDVNEVYSNPDGTIQYIELHTNSNGQEFLSGHDLRSKDSAGNVTATFTFPSNSPSPTAGRFLLLATSGLEAVAGITPDFIIPDSFLEFSGGTVELVGADSLTFPAFPSDTSRSFNASGNEIAASPTNFMGLTGTINLPAVDPDTDGDGVPDLEDAFPNDPSESADADDDGVGDNADTDDDNDGVPDSSDSFPTDSTRTVDADSVDFKYRSPINYFQGNDEYNNQSILQVSSLTDQVNTIKLALFDENGIPYDYATVMGSGFANHAGDGKVFTFIQAPTVAASAGELEGIAHGYLLSTEPVVVVNWMRSRDGFLTEINPLLNDAGGIKYAHLMNDTSNIRVETFVVLTSNSDSEQAITISVTNTFGDLGDCVLTLPANGSFQVTGSYIENTCGFSGSTNDDSSLQSFQRKMRLRFESTGQFNAALITRQIADGKLANISHIESGLEELATGQLVDAWSFIDEEIAGISCSELEGASIFSQESAPVYLGFFGDGSASDSINNADGTYGTPNGVTSIRDTLSEYGSDSGNFSITNSSTSTPPVIVKEGNQIGFLSANSSISKTISIETLDSDCNFTSSNAVNPFF